MSEGEYKNSWIWRDGISEGEETHKGERTVAEEYKWFLLDGLKTRTEMETSTAKKLQTSLFLTLLFSLACDTQTVPDCCRQKTCSCRIYDLLHGTGNHAAGILTLGKRKTDGQAYQSRLYRLLHASGNHAAGILTMGKRGEAGSIQSPDNSMVNQMCPSPPSVLDHYSSSDSM